MNRPDDEAATLHERWIAQLKEKRAVAVALVLTGIMGGVAVWADAYRKVKDAFQSKPTSVVAAAPSIQVSPSITVSPAISVNPTITVASSANQSPPQSTVSSLPKVIPQSPPTLVTPLVPQPFLATKRLHATPSEAFGSQIDELPIVTTLNSSPPESNSSITPDNGQIAVHVNDKLIIGQTLEAACATNAEASDCGSSGHDQRIFSFDYSVPGKYQMVISSAHDKKICWVTWNEEIGTPPISGASPGNWHYYGIDRKESDYLGVVHVDVPCPNGSFSISELIDANKSIEKDQRGRKIEILQRQLQGCTDGFARRKGYWVVVQTNDLGSCPSEAVMDSLIHPWGFERW